MPTISCTAIHAPMPVPQGTMLVAPGTMPGPPPCPVFRLYPPLPRTFTTTRIPQSKWGATHFVAPILFVAQSRSNTIAGLCSDGGVVGSGLLFPVFVRGGLDAVATSGCNHLHRMSSALPDTKLVQFMILKWMGAHGSTDANLIVAVRAKYNKTNAILNYFEWWTYNKITYKVGLW